MKTNSGFHRLFVLGSLVFTVLVVPAAPFWAEEKMGGYDESIG